MSGPRQVLEAPWGGFFSTYARETATPAATLAGLGTEFRIARSGMKPYACCRGLHATLDALFEVMKETGAGSNASSAWSCTATSRSARSSTGRKSAICSTRNSAFSTRSPLAQSAAAPRSISSCRFAPKSRRCSG